MSHGRKEVIQVWSDMRVSKYWLKQSFKTKSQISLWPWRERKMLYKRTRVSFDQLEQKDRKLNAMMSSSIERETETTWTIKTVVKVTAISDKTEVGKQNTERPWPSTARSQIQTRCRKNSLKRIKRKKKSIVFTLQESVMTQLFQSHFCYFPIKLPPPSLPHNKDANEPPKTTIWCRQYYNADSKIGLISV